MNQKAVSVMAADLPLACPLPSQKLWNKHPKVYLNFDDHGKAKCPYCGTDYTVTDMQNAGHGH
jgi:uncharacterized Zn-finger protein